VITGQADPLVEIDWHFSDRHLGGSNRSVVAVNDRPGELGNLTSGALLVRPPEPLWKRIVTLQSFGWRYRSLRNRLRARSRQLARAALIRVRIARLLFHAQPGESLLERARTLITGRRRPRPIAPELRIPVGVRSIAIDGMKPALALEPFAFATRTASDIVQIDVATDGQDLVIAGGLPVSYYYNNGVGRRWLAAHLPHVHPPIGFSPQGRAATTRLDQIAPTTVTERRRARMVAAARHYRAVDCSSTSLDAVTTARLIVDLAGAGVPLAATAVPDEVAGLLGPDLVAAIEGCDVEALADPRLRERHSVTLRRLVYRCHSVYENLAALAAAHGHAVSASPGVSILMATNRPNMVTFAIEQMAAQQYPNVEILCGLHGFSLSEATRERVAAIAPHAQLFEVSSDRDLGQVLAFLGERASGDLVTKWDDDDWYTTEHLNDLVAAMRYSGAGVVAKAAEYVYLSSLDLTLRRFRSNAETFSTTVAGGTLMLTRSMLERIGGWPAGPRRVDRRLIEAVEAVGAPIYRVHGLGYLLRRDHCATNHTWLAEDDYFLAQAVDQRPGLDLEFAGVVG
jgi:Glycosyl transferase family 2